jgi:outer membrane murein-binding lipoprotein Lpp
MTDYIVNEVVCVLSNNFGKTPRANIALVFGDFYTSEEICEAKKILLSIAEKLDPKPADELKKIKAARSGEGKLKREIEDVLQLYTLIDLRKPSLPLFLAADTSRIASFRSNEIQINAIATNINDLKTQVSELSAAVNHCVVSSKAAAPATLSDTQTSMQTYGSSDAGGSTGQQMWTTVVAKSGGTGGSPVQRLLPPRRKIVGSRVDGPGVKSKLLATKEVRLWHVFIGRLGKDTTDVDLTDFLQENDIVVSEVRRLKANHEWQEKSAAFRVSVALSCKDSVMKPALWPGNVEVRDWFFKPRTG